MFVGRVSGYKKALKHDRAWVNHLLNKYAHKHERKTEITSFESIAIRRVAVADKKLYVNKQEITMWENGKYLTPGMQKQFKQPDIFLSSETNINRDNLGPIYVPKKGDTFPIHEETNWRYLLPIIMMEGHTATLVNDEVSYQFTLQDPNEVFRRKGKESVYKEYFPHGGNLLTPWSRSIQDDHFKFLMIDGKPASQLTEYVVTQDYYWAMGDNRDDSLDSRYWGFVPDYQILGTPLLSVVNMSNFTLRFKTIN